MIDTNRGNPLCSTGSPSEVIERTEGEIICDKFHTMSSSVAENLNLDRSVTRMISK